VDVGGTVVSDELGIRFKTLMNAAVQPGMSGGPAADENGRLVGVVYGAAGTATLFTPIVFARVLLQAAGIDCSQ